MKIIGRREQKRELQRIVDSGRPEFLAVYGRRRAGKTYLIREFFEGDFCFSLTGLSKTDADTKTQIEGFNAAVRRYFPYDARPVADWFEAFELLTYLIDAAPLQGNGKKVIFIDEMPWLDTRKSGFFTALEHFWNSWAAARPEVLLIACGSSSSWMVNELINNTGGLYNRVTRTMLIEQFTLGECEEYFRYLGLSLGRQQVVESYMVFGGVPYYMSLMDTQASLTQSIDRLCFSKGAKLATEFYQLYATLFGKNNRHREVAAVLASRSIGLTRNEILAGTGMSNGGGITRMLEELELSGFIRRYQPFGRKTRDSLYQLVDAFSLFHLRFMSELSKRDRSFWTKFSSTGAYRAWSGYAFERVCLAHVQQILNVLGISGVLTECSSWRSVRSDPGAQVDLVIDRADGIINLCEMKYSNQQFVIDKAYEMSLRNKRGAFETETRTRKGVHLTLVSTYGLLRNSHSGVIQSQVTMDDLFA
jgi:predicted AAA+ superfamily ATPase